MLTLYITLEPVYVYTVNVVYMTLSLTGHACHVQAIQAWRDNSGFGRVQLVKQYFLCVEGAFMLPHSIVVIINKQVFDTLSSRYI